MGEFNYAKKKASILAGLSYSLLSQLMHQELAQCSYQT